MYSIEKSKIYQKDIAHWKTVLAECNDNKIKSDLESLIRSLNAEVKKLDKSHSEVLEINRLSFSINEQREKIRDLRIAIDKKITEWNFIKKLNG